MAKNPCDLNQNGERNKKEEESLEIGVVGDRTKWEVTSDTDGVSKWLFKVSGLLGN